MEAEDYYNKALAVAEAEYARLKVGESTVCAVAINAKGGHIVSLFSGKDGYKQLKDLRQTTKPVRGDVGAAITSELTSFLQSGTGGGFTTEQINKRGFDDQHKRGAMNCAEPKIYNHITVAVGGKTEDWVLLSFTRDQGKVVYWPPCKNCRRWAYQHFNNLSWVIARKYGGSDALKDAKILDLGGL